MIANYGHGSDDRVMAGARSVLGMVDDWVVARSRTVHRPCAEGAAAIVVVIVMMMVVMVIAADRMVKAVTIARAAIMMAMRQCTAGGGKEKRAGRKGGGEQRNCRSGSGHHCLLGFVFTSPWSLCARLRFKRLFVIREREALISFSLRTASRRAFKGEPIAIRFCAILAFC